ncbi:protein MpUGT13 [Marchantia polymorpha subsp. ruderalis]|nr:hypothetical protein MARPO_0207s0004 [Marchantia polymorpha]BBN03581.1 hypothetical protein Mp_2g24660 [Marchantia polymorpha subsp. ruderalis]|eukprot:PTQ27294.1 hypothetical protein MARPO_0207s0004 [Marchantia polymorpha]
MAEARVLLIAFPSQENVAACCRLALGLTSKNVKVTFVALKKYVNQIKKVFSAPSFGNVEVEGLEEPRNRLFNRSKSMEDSFMPYLKKLIDARNDEAKEITFTCLMADRYLPWSKDVAKRLEIPWFVFFGNSAMEARMHQVAHELHIKRKLKVKGDRLSGVDKIVKAPGLTFLRPRDLLWSCSAYPAESLATGEFLIGAAGLVINTFEDLELDTINSIQNALPKPSGSAMDTKLFLIGPMSNDITSGRLSHSAAAEDVSTSWMRIPPIQVLFSRKSTGARFGAGFQRCIEWFNRQIPCSVLYVHFGTISRLHPQEIVALAHALQSCQERFVWVLSQDHTHTELAMIADLQRRVEGRGRIVGGWVPQTQLLCHPCVAAFLSHCDWTSCLDAVVAGIPVLAWPQISDQHANARLLSNVLEMAIPLTKNMGQPPPARAGLANAIMSFVANLLSAKEQRSFLDEKDIETGIRMVMRGDEGKHAKHRAVVLRGKAASAVYENEGESETNWEALVTELQHIHI